LNPASVLLVLVGAYVVVGAAFGCAFVLVGAKRVDPVAAHAPLHVRLLFLPGSAALWPFLAKKWLATRSGGNAER
jgi:hypothetical protein